MQGRQGPSGFGLYCGSGFKTDNLYETRLKNKLTIILDDITMTTKPREIKPRKYFIY